MPACPPGRQPADATDSPWWPPRRCFARPATLPSSGRCPAPTEACRTPAARARPRMIGSAGPLRNGNALWRKGPSCAGRRVERQGQTCERLHMSAPCPR
eukprot:2738751-Pyramimonas_sp.AAC.1